MDYCKFCMARLKPEMQFCPDCGKSQDYDCPENQLLPGTTLDNGRFLLGAAIGAGGFGITYIAQDTRLRVPVAIKEYYPVGYANRSHTASVRVTVNTQQRNFFDKGKRKFLSEARILASLNDEPGIVDVRDFFEENDTAYLVMECLKGETLKAYLLRKGKLSFDEAYHLLWPVMRSLSKVHAMHLMHRDISPDNIMLTDSGVKLLDFGAAREVFEDGENSVSVVLKRGYAPLEQYSRKGQGAWTDVYALCATLYKCITGASPLEATQRPLEPLTPPSDYGAVISPAEEEVLLHGLALYARDRIQDVDTLMRAFQAAKSQPQSFIPNPVPAPKPISVSKPISAPSPVSAPKAASMPEPAPALKAVSTPEPVSAPKAVSTPEPVSVPKAVSTPEPVPAPKAVSVSEPVSLSKHSKDPGWSEAVTMGSPRDFELLNTYTETQLVAQEKAPAEKRSEKPVPAPTLATPPKPKEREKQGGAKRPLVILLLVLLLAGTIAGALAMKNRGSADGKQTPRTSTSAPEDSLNAAAIEEVGGESIGENTTEPIIAAHKHDYKAEVTKKATCSKTGVKTFTCACGDSYIEEIPVDKKNHVNTKNVKETYSTCKDHGYTAGVYCNDCGKYISGHNQKALASHKTTTRGAYSATCTKNGYSGDVYCTVCGKKIQSGHTIYAYGHSLDSSGKCTRCGKQINNSTGWE